jgi:hypothetical protein
VQFSTGFREVRGRKERWSTSPDEAPATESAGLVNLCLRVRSPQLYPDSGLRLPASRWCHPDVYLETDPCVSK